MRKIVVCIFLTGFVFLFTTIFTHAQNGNNLLDLYLNKLEGLLMEKKNTLIDLFENQKNLSDRRHEELLAFYKEIGREKSRNVTNYQQDYLSRIAETRDILGERNLEDFEEGKKQELREEIGQDVKQYLEELLQE
ncbi:hypothetical protein GMD78_04635 [Ornithinibacillus sp. L9]|uniref:Uncharacterized protein n=1 Tax=Ornithinibacillus caprae TaxID=2678566 RepID=A0A6N8FI05_9BACI|nr:hypothetical protein [Ornithinibacillus caprae]MUK87687.1 hypothetical protein [Ornithinibacillus caprae]